MPNPYAEIMSGFTAVRACTASDISGVTGPWIKAVEPLDVVTSHEMIDTERVSTDAVTPTTSAIP
jgi:hypothetical protein